MRVSLIQMNSNGSFKENKTKSFEFLKKALLDKPDLICLSELFLAWGSCFDDIKLTEEDIIDYKCFAKENNVNIILGSIPILEEKSKKVTNTSFVINRSGNIIGKYDKKYMYVYDGDDFKVDESCDTLKGNDLGLFLIDNIKIGIGICFDLRFPEYFRELIKGGAEVIFLPSHFRKNTGNIAWSILPEARAIENQVYFCACNQTGDGIIGNTKVISYDGTVLGCLSDEDDVLTVDLDLNKQRKYRKEFPVLKQMEL